MAKVYITNEASKGAAWVSEDALSHYLPNGWVESEPPAKKRPAKKAAKKAAAKAAPTKKDQE